MTALSQAFISPLPLNNVRTRLTALSPVSTRRNVVKTTVRAVVASPSSSSASKTADFPITHLITILSHNTSAPAEILQKIAEHNGSASPIRTLSPHAFESRVFLPSSINIDTLRTNLDILGKANAADVILQDASIGLEPKRLAVFDLDSTLIAQETIDELADLVNVKEQVKAITEAAMNGQIGFREALSRRVALLKGLPAIQLNALKDRVKFTEGAREVISALRRLNCRTALVSGGFHFLADHVRDELGLDFCHANRLEVDPQGLLTGKTVGEIVDGAFKQNCLMRLAYESGLRKEQVIAVGDGSNDLLMMGSAGLGVAFNAKPIVQDRAKARINLPSLRNVLYLLGLEDAEIGQLLH